MLPISTGDNTRKEVTLTNSPISSPEAQKDGPMVLTLNQLKQEEPCRDLSELRLDQNDSKENEIKNSLLSQSKPGNSMNDDINLRSSRERSIPRQQSLQPDFEGHSHGPSFIASEATSPQKLKLNLPSQRSLEKDDSELIAIASARGRRESD